jgi:hypothetical protein
VRAWWSYTEEESAGERRKAGGVNMQRRADGVGSRETRLGSTPRWPTATGSRPQFDVAPRKGEMGRSRGGGGGALTKA